MPTKTKNKPTPKPVTVDARGQEMNDDIIPIPAIARTAIVKARAAALTITQEVIDLAKDLVIVTEADYHTADDILHKIKVIQKRAGEPLEEVIRPVRQGLDGVYAINRAIQDPLLDGEVIVKEKMRVWKIAEMDRVRKSREEEERRQREYQEQVRREQEAADKLRAEANQVPAPQPFEVAQDATGEVYAIPATPLPQPIRAASSTARQVKRWRVTDLELLVKAVELGMVPVEMVMVNVVAMNDLFKRDPAAVEGFPGVETYMDIQISGR
jgi:hypothetical protein